MEMEIVEKDKKMKMIIGLLTIALTDLQQFNYSYLSELDEAESLIQSSIHLIQEVSNATSTNI